uniref:Secreted protein n=1 Tax=Parascaris univalens TaxID=6257 RepID=A0A915CB87_PARUN
SKRVFILFILFLFQSTEHSLVMNVFSPIQCFYDPVGSCAFFKESLHLIAGGPLLLLPIRGVHSVILFTQSPFSSADIFAAHLNFPISASVIQSFTFVSPRSHSFAVPCTSLIPAMTLSILLCATASSFRTFLVVTQISELYKIVGIAIFSKFPPETHRHFLFKVEVFILKKCFPSLFDPVSYICFRSFTHFLTL